MYSMPMAMIVAAGLSQEARSALPNAPVVPHVDRVLVLPRTRKAVASGLRYLADLVAPARPVRHTTAHSALRREAG
jgi:hypothetical protein